MSTLIIEGDEILLSAVIILYSITTGDGEDFYRVHFNGGQHISVTESSYSHSQFRAQWLLAVA